MRTPARVLIALLSLPVVSGAQIIRRPPPSIDRRVPTEPAPLPPETIAPVARDLAYKRLRWSAEGYGIVSAFEVPTANGTSRFATFGAGTHGDYRLGDRFSATIDLTAALSDGLANAETAEIGTRFSPLSWEQHVRPFFDARAAFLRMYDIFPMPTQPSVGGGITALEFNQAERYSRGLGGIVGAGFEYSLTRSWALTTELSALRGRMTTYRLDSPASLPLNGSYWMTSYRYSLGFKFSPVRTLSLKQNPSSGS